MTKTIVVQAWEESEKSWGIRPDGWSIHRSEEDRVAFIADYWAGMPDGPAQGAGPAPNEYSRPRGSYLFDLTDELEPAFDKIKGYGARLHSVTNGVYSTIREWLDEGPEETLMQGRQE